MSSIRSIVVVVVVGVGASDNACLSPSLDFTQQLMLSKVISLSLHNQRFDTRTTDDVSRGYHCFCITTELRRIGRRVGLHRW